MCLFIDLAPENWSGNNLRPHKNDNTKLYTINNLRSVSKAKGWSVYISLNFI